MRKTNAFLSLMLTIALLFTAFSFSFPASTSAATPIQTYVSAMQPGWNLGNTLDAFNPDDPTGGGETSWGNPVVTQAFIQQIAAQGFKSIRIPITWNYRIGGAPNYAIDPAFMDRVQQVVDWSLQAGLYVMINVHHDAWMWVSSMPTDHNAVMARYNAVWTQIADRFKNHSDKLMFESINEPEFSNVDITTQLALLNELNTSFVHLVRASGGGNAVRPLVLPTLYCNHEQVRVDSLASTLAALNDPNLIVTVHYYGLWHFAVNIAGYTTFNADAKNDIDTMVNNVYNTFVSKGIPVVIGELGILGHDKNRETVERGEMLKFFEYLLYSTQAKNITTMWWDNGSYFNRTTYQWSDPDLFNIFKQSLTGRSSTTDTDLIFLKAGTAVQDAVINLNLNGNTFVSLLNGTAALSSGTDYTLNGNVLTIKANALANYASGSFGEKTVLSVRVNSGPDWKIHVRYSNTPVLSKASGNSSGGLVIPTAFNGDVLATMEAVYTNGTNAGPHNWTSYKEYAYAFLPNYANNTIMITPKFFAETTGGTINLTFHFWSGAIVKYQLTTKGGRITGTPQ
ncbi:MAG: cellulase family glycosylhydrolase [Bacillota bacterium]